MNSLWNKLNNKKGFTLVEMLITLTVTFTILLFMPKPNHQLSQRLEHELFLQQIEHQLALFQQRCLLLETYGTIRFYPYPINQVVFIINQLDTQEINVIQLPDSLQILSNRDIRFDSTGKSSSVFTLSIQSQQRKYTYRVQLGGGRLFRDEQRVFNF